MGSTLDALHHLQQIDQQLRAARDRIESKQRSARGIKKRVTDLERQIEQAHAQQRQAQSDADRLELDRKVREQHAAKLREALNHSKTNKEYAAVLTELNTDKADMVKLEEIVLGAMTKADELKKQELALRESLAREQQRFNDAEKSVKDLEHQLSGELRSLEQQRAAAATGIPREVLDLFNRAADQNEGEAMARVERTHPKRVEFICGGCNMSIPLEIINLLQSRGEIRQCNTCLRILYLEQAASVAH